MAAPLDPLSTAPLDPKFLRLAMEGPVAILWDPILWDPAPAPLGTLSYTPFYNLEPATSSGITSAERTELNIALGQSNMPASHRCTAIG